MSQQNQKIQRNQFEQIFMLGFWYFLTHQDSFFVVKSLCQIDLQDMRSKSKFWIPQVLIFPQKSYNDPTIISRLRWITF